MLREAGWLKNLALSLVHDEHLAEDLVQSTWLTALMRPPRESGALRSWLRKVALRMAVRTRARGQRRKAWELGAARSEEQPPAADLVARASVHRALVDAVLDLEEPYRSTVLMRYFEDLSHREIARRQNVAYATVQTRLHRALAQLRARLDRASGGREAWKTLIMLPPLHAAALVSAATGGLIVGAQLKVGLVVAAAIIVGIVAWQWSRKLEPEPASVDAARSAEVAEPGLADAPDGSDRVAGSKATIAPQPFREIDEAASTLVGVVVDGRNDRPVAGAEAILSSDADPLARPRSVATSPDGRFSFSTEQPFHRSALRLTIRSPEFVPSEIDSPSVNPNTVTGRSVDLGRIRLVRGASAHGRVIAAAGGQPVEGALLFLDTKRPYATVPSFITARPAGRSGPDGAFTLTERVAPTPNNPAVVFALHDGGVDWALLQVVQDRDEVGNLEIVARPGAQVGVRVVDAQEKPISGVAVVAVPCFPPFGLPDVYVDRMTSARNAELASWSRITTTMSTNPDAGPRAMLGRRFLVTTDAQGTARFEQLPLGRFEAEYDRTFQNSDTTAYEFVVLGDRTGSVRWKASSGVTNVTLVLKPEQIRSVSGSVRTLEGSPIPGASVWLYPVGSAKTDAEGRYRFGETPAFDRTWVTAAGKGFATVRQPVAIKTDGTETVMNFTLSPAVPIAGRVVDQNGETLSGVFISLMRPGDDGALQIMPDSRPTGADGRFSFTNSDAGEWKVHLDAPKTDLASSANQIVQGGDQQLELVMYRVEPGRATVIADLVDLETGKPVDASTASLWRDVKYANGETIDSVQPVLSAGRIVARGVGAGKWTLIVKAQGFGEVRRPIEVSPTDEELRIRVEIGRPGVIVAKIVLDDLPAGARPERFAIFTWNESPRWVTAPGKPAPKATRGFGAAEAANDWTCRFEDVRPNVPIRFWVEGYGREDLYDERIVSVGFGEEKTIELRPVVRGTATFTTPPTLSGHVDLHIAGDDGGWHHVASWELQRGKNWSHPQARRPGPFRWRAQLWPLDLPAALRVPKTIEGASEVQAGKTVTIPIALDPK